MTPKLTAAYVRSNDIIFYPRSEAEAAAIQNRLFGLGLGWAVSDQRSVMNTAESVRDGLVVLGGKIYTRGTGDTRTYEVCTLAQFDENYLTPEQAFIVEQFNRLSARIDALAEKVDKIYGELYPEVGETKPHLKAPGRKP